MLYEVIKEIKNSCEGNQMRDVFFDEYEISDIDAWLREKEPNADEYIREELSNSTVVRVWKAGMLTEYTFTEA